MAAADVPAAEAVARAALYDGAPGVDDPVTIARGLRRIGHLQQTDPAGAWVAEAPDGALVGMALALVREGIWGLSLFGVAAEHRSRGIGRALLDAALTTHGAGARGAPLPPGGRSRPGAAAPPASGSTCGRASPPPGSRTARGSQRRTATSATP